MPTELPQLLLDADNHYYESRDAFTRHLPADMRRRGRPVGRDRREAPPLAGEKVTRVLANPTFDPICPPGSLIEYFRAKNDAGTDVEQLFGDLDPLSEHPEYLHRDARLETLPRRASTA